MPSFKQSFITVVVLAVFAMAVLLSWKQDGVSSSVYEYLPLTAGSEDVGQYNAETRSGSSKKENPVFFTYFNKGFLNFSKNFKNPCWYEDKVLKCLPYFYLVGAPKSGTTDLHKRICSHFYYVKARSKEPHWITRRRFGAGDPATKFPRYLTYFDRISSVLANNSTSRRDLSRFITGDCSASTLWDNDHWRLLPGNEHAVEPIYTNSDVIHQLNPATKILIILRNPIDRLYSGYKFFNSARNLSAEEFHSRVVNAIGVYNECFKTHSMRWCLYDRDTAKKTLVRLRIGVYHVYLADWFRVFPRNQVFVLKLEDYSPKPEQAMDDVFQFLGLDPQKASEGVASEKHANSQRQNTAYVGPMLDKTRNLLYNFYKPYNIRLAAMLEDDRFNYGRK